MGPDLSKFYSGSTGGLYERSACSCAGSLLQCKEAPAEQRSCGNDRREEKKRELDVDSDRSKWHRRISGNERAAGLSATSTSVAARKNQDIKSEGSRKKRGGESRNNGRHEEVDEHIEIGKSYGAKWHGGEFDDQRHKEHHVLAEALRHRSA